MRKYGLVILAFAVSAVGVSAQGKPTLVVQTFTKGAGVELPYDLEQMQPQLVAEFRVLLGKDFTIAAEPPAATAGAGATYTLDGEFTGWRAGNAAKRLIIGLGSGRESSDLHYRVTDSAGKTVVQREDTIRTSFFSQHAGSTGTLAHPIAKKIADRIKDAKLK